MFGLSFGELVLLVIVAVVVIGPKDMPKVLRKLGHWSGQLRRWAFDLRAQSGIDEVLRSEGLESVGKDLQEIRKLARGELSDVAAAARVEATPPLFGAAAAARAAEAPSVDAAPAASGAPAAGEGAPEVYHHGAYHIEVPREREWPREGADAYGALPDGATVYDVELPRSPLADDPGYTCGLDA